MASTFTKSNLADKLKIIELTLFDLGRFFSCIILLTRPPSIVPFVCCLIEFYVSLVLGKAIEDQPLVHNGFFPKRIYIVQCIERAMRLMAIMCWGSIWMPLEYVMLVSINLIYMGWFASILLARINPRLGQQAFTLYGIHDQDLAAIQVRAKDDLRIILLALLPWKRDPILNDRSEELENIAYYEAIIALPSISNEEIEDSDDEEDKETKLPCLETVEEHVPETAVTETAAERFIREWQRVSLPESESETDPLAKYLHQHGSELEHYPETGLFPEHRGSEFASDFELVDQIYKMYEPRDLQRASTSMCCQESGPDYLEPQETETGHYLPQQVTETDHFDWRDHNYASINQSLCLENQLMRSEIQDILALNEEHETYWSTELTRISTSHEADRKNWEQVKQKIMKKLDSSKSLVISGEELAFEQEVRFLVLQETIIDLSTKLSTATRLSQVSDRLLQEKVEECSNFEKCSDDLQGKLSVQSLMYNLTDKCLMLRKKKCKKLQKENSELVAMVEEISDEKMENSIEFEQEKSELEAKLSAALASSALYCELLHDYGAGR